MEDLMDVIIFKAKIQHNNNKVTKTAAFQNIIYHQYYLFNGVALLIF